MSTIHCISDIVPSSSYNSNSINPAEHFQEDLNPNNFHNEHPIGENDAPPQNAIPLDVVDQFRLLNFDMELELFARIRLLENRMIEGLPPQLNLGEYETLVRGFLDDTLTINHYCTTITNELFEITVLELKANLVEKLFDLLMSEPDARFIQILADSPFPERSIKPEALSYLNDQLTALNIHDPRSNFEKNVLDNFLRYFVQDVQLYGRNSVFYRHFLEHFKGSI